MEQTMRTVIVLAALSAMLVAPNVSAQECLRPAWTKCESFPYGGRHTGTALQGAQVQMDVPPGPDICVINNEEIGGRTYARFARNGQPWPNRDWGVDIDSFCFFKN